MSQPASAQENAEAVKCNHHPKRAVTLTAAVTALITFFGQYALTKATDQVVTSASSDLRIEMTGTGDPAYSVVVPSIDQPESVRVPYNAEAIALWARNNGGGPANAVLVEMTVWAREDRPMTLRGVRARINKCQSAPAGAYVLPVGGGEVGTRLVRINLDSGDLEGKGVEDQVTGETFTFPLEVSRAEAERFRTMVVTATQDCDFDIEIGYDKGQEVKWTSVDHGSYRVVSSSNATASYKWVQEKDAEWATLEPS